MSLIDFSEKKVKSFSHRYDIWFGGEPPPTVTWEREGTVIQVGRVTSDLWIGPLIEQILTF